MIILPKLIATGLKKLCSSIRLNKEKIRLLHLYSRSLLFKEIPLLGLKIAPFGLFQLKSLSNLEGLYLFH